MCGQFVLSRGSLLLPFQGVDGWRMALAKTVTFIVYVILVLVAINFPLTLWSQFSMGTLLAIALLHLFECY